ncbi:MAG: NAD(P)-binding domain-containing protein [Microbacterium sp.]|jgi:predicted dinucleotide-binding enzyme|uniref:NADPH-dependent F420 reductase n=1 Tax=Microbacterium sp. TaxID=51671 RepID=UPI00282193F9|nr:NAD(P)-binding domain-containing protein [Microbacterium sp.]MDR2321453.1 NAD(P)-binding domain-containing protein [Microbacterium sp.]
MTSISIIGSGKMGAAIAEVASRAGADIQILKRSPASMSAARPGFEYGVIGDELTGDLVVLAVPSGAYASILEHYRDRLGGRVVIDISNPIDFSTYDALTSPADSSTAAELAKALPEGAAVVKAFNVNLGDTLTSGTNGTTRTSVLFAGDYADAKMAVAALIEAAGMRAVDVGPLTRARELEAMGFLQIIMAALGKTRYESGCTLLE